MPARCWSLSIPGNRAGVRFGWTGDIAGQGWGINPDIGGMRIFESMRRLRPEVRNNWYPGQIIDDARYTEKRVDVLAARARQAFFEYVPISPGPVDRALSYGPLLDVFMVDMRTYKDPNGANTYADPTRGLVVPDGPTRAGGRRAVRLRCAAGSRAAVRAGAAGCPRPRRDRHRAAHRRRATVGDFTPFWEFVSGPANAGPFGPNALDGTFGPQAAFVHAPPAPNTSPLDGFQHFGEVDIDCESKDLTVRLRDLDGAPLWSTTLHA